MLFRKPVQLFLIAAIVLATVAVSVPGFLALTYPVVDNSIKLIALFAIVTFVISTVFRLSPLKVGASSVFAISLACGQAWPLLTVLLFISSSILLGQKILGHWKSGSWSLHLLLGAGILGTLVGIAAHFPINYPASYSALLSIPFLINGRHAKTLVYRLYLETIAYQPPSAFIRLLDVAVCSLAALYVVIAFMPEVGHDALAMHLFIPAHLLEQHQWGFDVDTYVWASWPMLGDWIYSLVYMLAGETSARLANTFFILLVAWQIREFVIWAGGSSSQGRWAVLIFLSTPLVFSEVTSLFIESVWTAFTMAGIFTLLKMSDNTTDRRDGFIRLVLTGTLLGFAIAAKAVTLSILPVLVIVLLVQYKAWVKPGLFFWLVGGTLCFLVAGAIPYAFSWYVTDNPVFPFFNTIFYSSKFPLADFQPPALFGKGVSWNTLYNMTFFSEHFIEGKAGAAGFQWLLVPAACVALICLRHKKALCILLIACGAMVATYNSMAYLRYILPSFALMTVALVLVFTGTLKWQKIVGSLVGSVLVTLNIWFIQSSTYYGQLWPTVIFSQEERDSYLIDNQPTRKLVEMVNILNAAQHPVAVFASPFTAGLKSDALYRSWYNLKWLTEFDTAKTEPQLTNVFRKRNIEWLIVDSAMLSVDKMRLITNISLPVATINGIELRRFNDIYQYTQELLKTPDFSTSDGWALFSPSSYDAAQKLLNVNVKTPATQAVAVEPGQRYKLSVSVRCSSGPTEGRLQANWIDATGTFITTNIKVYECSNDWVSHEIIVTAPKDAVTAVIYASGHTETPLAFKSVSFKK